MRESKVYTTSTMQGRRSPPGHVYCSHTRDQTQTGCEKNIITPLGGLLIHPYHYLREDPIFSRRVGLWRNNQLLVLRTELLLLHTRTPKARIVYGLVAAILTLQ